MKRPENPKAIYATPAEAAIHLDLEGARDEYEAQTLLADGEIEIGEALQARGYTARTRAQRVLENVPERSAPICGEIAHRGSRELTNTLDDPNLINLDATGHRVELADHAGVLSLALDAAQTVEARNSIEKMLAHQLATAHALAMRFAGRASLELNAGRPDGAESQAMRLGLVAARLMEASQKAATTLQKLRSGGQQTVVVQHVNVERGNVAVVGVTGAPRGDGGGLGEN